MVTRGRKYFMLSQPTRLVRNFSIKRRKNGEDFKSVNVKESLVAALLGRIFEVAGAAVTPFPH